MRMRAFRLVFFVTITILFQCIRYSNAIPARDIPFEITQPDGTVIRIRGNGDEREHWLSDEFGYGIVQNEDGEFVYLNESEEGEIISTNEPVTNKGGPKVRSAAKKKGLHKKPTDCTKMICGGSPKKDLKEKDDRKNPNNRKLGHIRGTTDPSKELEDTTQHIEEDDAMTIQQRRRRTEDDDEITMKTTGVLKNLVILLRFKDHAKNKKRVEKTPTREDIDVLMNSEEPDRDLCPAGSLKSIYKELSYGKLVIESTITEWFVTDETEAWYADGASGTTNLHQGIRDALDYLDKNNIIDFSEFDVDSDGKIDAITILHSGYGAEWIGTDGYGAKYKDRIWSHKWTLWGDASGKFIGPWYSKDGVEVWDYHISPALWGTSGSSIGHIGVIAHETGHFLGMLDLYDTDGGGTGLGNYCLMANSWGWDKRQEPPGTMSCWTKMKLGWLTPQVPVYGVNEVAASTLSQDCYIIGDGQFGFPRGEYLLIENRQPIGMDETLLQGGLAIYHADDYAGYNSEGYPGQRNWPENGRHYRIALLQADGEYHLEQDKNSGDTNDFFHGDGVDELMPSRDVFGPYPNTDSYQRGNVVQTKVQIYDISKSSETMTFTFSDGRTVGLGAPSPKPSPNPTPSPSSHPSPQPSEQPSSKPSISFQQSDQPSRTPSEAPAANYPSDLPSSTPSISQTSGISAAPTTHNVFQMPTLTPSQQLQCSVKGERCDTANDCCDDKARCTLQKGKFQDFFVVVNYLCSS